jgi:small subunit ribosomal protein S2
LVEPVTVKQLLEAGAHFGHQTSHWNPKMKNFIFTQRNGIHIIDLEKTVTMLSAACTFLEETAAKGQTILFVGTKKQAHDIIEEEAKRCGAFFVNLRWLGGMLTNFSTIQSRIDYLVRLEDRKNKGELENLPKKERGKIDEEIERLNRRMGGFKEMTALPGAIFLIDPTKDKIALEEARKMRVPIVAVSDTNCDPTVIDHPIPANDDAIKAIRLLCGKVASAVLEGKTRRESAIAAAEAAAKTPETPAEEATMETAGSYTFSPDEEK